MPGKITISERKKICIKYNTWMLNGFDHLFYRTNESEDFNRVGKIYYKESNGLYHGEDSNKTKIEGSEEFEDVLVRLLERLDLI